MEREKKRYMILIAATLVNFVHGNPYIWTVFQPYVRAEYGLDVAASSQPFTLIIGTFAVGNILGGFLQHKRGSRTAIFIGSALMCGGFLLAAMAPIHMPFFISIGYGILGGVGSGCAFSVLVAVPQAWFPDKRGLVTGITIGIVGVSGVIMNPLCDVLLARYGFRISMLVVTVFYALLSFTGLWFVIEPSQKSELPVSEERIVPKHAYTTKEMLHTKTYYIISISMALAVPAYVLVNPLMKSLGMERGLTNTAALAGVLIASVGNILGRFLAPWLSDMIGRKKVLLGLYVIAMCSVIGIAFAEGALFILLISLESMTYGGFVGVYPVVTSDYFGMKYQGMNFGVVMIGYGLMSVFCPYLIKMVEKTSYGTDLSFVIAGILCGIGI
ncbi:MAG: MFS transporter, partial [Lachnospiraceae bacterium]